MADNLPDEVSVMNQIRSCGLEPTELDEGTYGSIFSVRDVNGAIFALKYIRDPDYNNIGYQGLPEIDILRRIEHPHIMHSPLIVTSMTCDLREALAITMPLADVTLDKIIPNKLFTTEIRLSILYKLATALAFLHHNNILHLDIKTTNIVLRDSIPYLIDFGLSMIVEDAKVGRNYPYELVSASNRPPEIFQGGRQYNEAVDVWSLGIVILWVLSGQPTIFSDKVNWGNKDVMMAEIVDLVGIRLPILLAGVRDKYRDGCLSLLRGMLDMDPGNRLTSQQVVDHPVFDDSREFIVGNTISPQYIPDYAEDHRNILKLLILWAQTIFAKNSAQSFFLAIDIYNRVGTFFKDKEPLDRMVMAAMSLVQAMKLLDQPYPIFPTYQKQLNEMVPEITSKDLLRGETEIIYYLDGVLYHSPYFDKLGTGDELKFTFDHIIMDRDSTLYLRADINGWSRITRTLVTNTTRPHKNISIEVLLS